MIPFPPYKYVVVSIIIFIFIFLYIYKKAFATKILLFHSQKCPHCVKFMPEWYKLVSKARFSLGITTMAIDLDNYPDIDKLKTNYDIISWPTVIIISGIKWKKFEDDENRSADTIWEEAINY